jgi:hypothetical protein
MPKHQTPQQRVHYHAAAVVHLVGAQ